MKRTKSFLLLAAVLVVGLSAQAQNATISVEITNVKSNDGKVMVGLFDSKENFLKTSVKGEMLDAVEGNLSVVFEGVTEGTYTVSVIHDENGNGKLDTNFMGIPSEPYGISKEGKSMFGPPSYEKAKFVVKAEDVDLTISL